MEIVAKRKKALKEKTLLSKLIHWKPGSTAKDQNDKGMNEWTLQLETTRVSIYSLNFPPDAQWVEL